MALSLKPSKLAGGYQYICQFDDAVDSEHKDFNKLWKIYLDGKGDPPLKPGAQPTIFNLRSIKHPRYRAIISGKASVSMELAYVQAASMALESVENLHNDIGEPVVLSHRIVGDVPQLSSESESYLGADVLVDIGGRAIKEMKSDPL